MEANDIKVPLSRSRSFGQKVSHVQYQILSNLSCNMDCAYCYENKTKQVNKYEDIIEYLTYLMERDKGITETVYLDWIGGEPLLVVSLLDKVNQWLINNAGKYGFKNVGFTHSTNGTMFIRPMVQEYVKKYRDYAHYGVSIDGTKEIHDKFRIFRGNRKGTYDVAMQGLRWLQSELKDTRNKVNVKATFTSETFKYYSDGVKSLLNLGLPKINANLVFEEEFNKEWSNKATLEIIDLMDYMVENNFDQHVEFEHMIKNGQVLSSMHNFSSFKPARKLKENWCGSCDQMVCLGFDKKVYGCNRFLTMDKPDMEIGYLEDGKIIAVNKELKEEVTKQFQYLSDTCKACPAQTNCASCVAVAYEQPDNVGIEDYVKSRKHCGWTWAKTISSRLVHMKKTIKKLEAEHGERRVYGM